MKEDWKDVCIKNLLNGEVILQASDIPLSKELHAQNNGNIDNNHSFWSHVNGVLSIVKN